MKAIRNIYLFLLSSLFCISLSAQPTDWKELQYQLATTVRAPEFVNKILDKNKLVGMPRRLAHEHLTEIYKSDEMLTYLVNEMRLAGFDKSKSNNSYEDGRKFGSELFLSLSMKGLSRLSVSDQRIFISYLSQWLNYASPEDCKYLITGGSSTTAIEAANIEMKYYYKFNEGVLRYYFYTLRQAMFAEIRDYPAARVLNPNQIKIADDAIMIELENRIKINNIPSSVLLAFQNMNTSSPKDVCEAGKIVVNSILEMKGFAADLAVEKYILSMQ